MNADILCTCVLYRHLDSTTSGCQGTDLGGYDALLGVEVGGGLVDEVDVGRGSQRQSNGHALQLTSTQVLHLFAPFCTSNSAFL